MNITVTLTKGELLDILSKQLDANVTGFEIVDGIPNILKHVLDPLKEQFKVDHITSEVICRDKIPAIKIIRSQVVNLSLANAKWVVENWNDWVNFVQNFGRFPHFEGQYPNIKMV